MQKTLSLIKRSIMGGVLVVVTLAFPLAGSSVSADCTPPVDSTPGVHTPTGADANTYTYQCTGDYANEWTNQYYAYNPATQQTTPLYTVNYRYNCTTQQWQMTKYVFSASQNDYYPTWVKSNVTPDQDTGCPVTTPPSGGPDSGSAGSTVANTGDGSTNTVDNSTGINIGSTNNNGLTMTNGIGSQATSGNAIISGNTVAGGATSGNAQTLSNVANLLQTTSNVFGPGTATFTANINGDVTGDFMFDPSAIMNTGANSTNNTANTGNLTVNQANNTDATINNTIDVGSTSGKAVVAGNTEAGDATSGDAQTIVNLMNFINSTVAAGQSFVGTININGNLNGDILLPQNLLNQLLASTGANSTNTASNNLNVNASDTNNNTTNITNDVNATAASGNAKVSGNTVGGDATTGDATTNVTLLNLTGTQVVGADDLLVFVNVLGHWVGMIMNAPAGTTAASLGGGITNTGANSINGSSNNNTIDANSVTNNNFGIHNTVNAGAQSGDATVRDNTVGGNATSGDASTAVNILNIANSNLNLSNWFGVLFINVFGAWNGSFGVNTSAGDPITNPSNNPVQAANQQAMVNSVKQFASFNSRTTSGGGTGSASSDTSAGSSSVLGTTTAVAKKVASDTAVPVPASAPHANFLMPLIGVGLAGAILLVSERGRFFGNKK